MNMTNDMFYQTNTQGFCPYRAFAPTQSHKTQGAAVGLIAPLPLRGVLDAASYIYELITQSRTLYSNIVKATTVQRIFEMKQKSATQRSSFEDKEGEV